MMEPEAFRLPPSDWVPNNPWLPVLVYRRAMPDGTANAPAFFEDLFGRNGWPAQWRNSIFPFHHYHSNAHEVLGIAAGGTDVLIGGPSGCRLSIAAGDILVLPAGTGHCNLSPGSRLLVVGAYPPGARWDTRRDALSSEELQRMAHVSFPASDPVTGDGGALPRLWAAASG